MALVSRSSEGCEFYTGRLASFERVSPFSRDYSMESSFSITSLSLYTHSTLSTVRLSHVSVQSNENQITPFEFCLRVLLAYRFQIHSVLRVHACRKQCANRYVYVALAGSLQLGLGERSLGLYLCVCV